MRRKKSYPPLAPSPHPEPMGNRNLPPFFKQHNCYYAYELTSLGYHVQNIGELAALPDSPCNVLLYTHVPDYVQKHGKSNPFTYNDKGLTIKEIIVKYSELGGLTIDKGTDESFRRCVKNLKEITDTCESIRRRRRAADNSEPKNQ